MSVVASISTKGGRQIEQRLNGHLAANRRKHRAATRAAAGAFQKAVKATVKGKMKRGVRVYPVGETSWKVKATGHIARFVIGGTAQHEVAPRGSEGAQSTFHHSGKGRKMMTGPAMAKRALAFPGASHPFPRAMIPAHSGDQTIIPRARAEGAEAARAAAMEVLKT